MTRKTRSLSASCFCGRGRVAAASRSPRRRSSVDRSWLDVCRVTVLAIVRADGALHDLRRRAGGGLDGRQADVRGRRCGMSGAVRCCSDGILDHVGLSDRRCISRARPAGCRRSISRSIRAETYTFWSGMIGGLFLMLCVLRLRSEPGAAVPRRRSRSTRRSQSLLMSAFVKIPLQLLILTIGVLVFVFYLFQTPPMLFNRAYDERRSRRAPRAWRYAALEQAVRARGCAGAPRRRALDRGRVSRQRRAGRDIRRRRVAVVRDTTATRVTTTSTTCSRHSSRRTCRSVWSG